MKNILILFSAIFIILFSSGCKKDNSTNSKASISEFISEKNASSLEIEQFVELTKPYMTLISKIDPSIKTSNISFNKLKVLKVDNKANETLVIELNSSSKEYKYVLSAPMLNSKIIRPLLVQTSLNRNVNYYDLENEEYFSLEYKEGIFDIVKAKMFNSQSNSTYISNTNNPYRCSWKGVNYCIQDAYSNHGFLSTWLYIQSAYLPHTAAAIAAICVMENVKCH